MNTTSRRSLSGKRLPADHERAPSWVELLLPGAKPGKDRPAPPTKADFVLRSRKAMYADLRRRDARAALREAGGNPSDISSNSLHHDVPVEVLDGFGRRRRRLNERHRNTRQVKGQRAFNRQQAAIARDNAHIEHLIAVAGGETGADATMRARAIAALEARRAAKAS